MTHLLVLTNMCDNGQKGKYTQNTVVIYKKREGGRVSIDECPL